MRDLLRTIQSWEIDFLLGSILPAARFEPGTAGWVARRQPLCYGVPGIWLKVEFFVTGVHLCKNLFHFCFFFGVVELSTQSFNSLMVRFQLKRLFKSRTNLDSFLNDVKMAFPWCFNMFEAHALSGSVVHGSIKKSACLSEQGLIEPCLIKASSHSWMAFTA